ncbi:MAG: thymidine kinase [Calditrichaeota bacterium]|nr:thymidine kinase [Candidatus Cloacimonadota bacterium]MCA9785630.1 thymidine kinase [Candidatus Cloacimonadota bacterium]MCB1046951.1 thymidine kinase [Calditrichota bacterium]MCB9473570.1 thymidine kinase [Candidatus Delongbacteria bacterium]
MQPGCGWIEVICGSMYSGKTEELIRRIRLATIARKKVLVVKPEIDSRYSRDRVVSHNQSSLPSVVIKRAIQIPEVCGDADVLGVDEAQFFDDELVAVCENLARAGTRVVVAGLDKDFRGRPFGPMPVLMSVAEYVTKQHAICVICGNPANFTQRKTLSREQVLLGAGDVYEARCRTCFTVPSEEQLEIFTQSDPAV